jgi:transposase InsO family protein
LKLHGSARLTVRQREELARAVLEQDWTLVRAAEHFRVSLPTATKWVRRFRAEGREGLTDRSSRPARLRAPTPEEVRARVRELRLERRTMRQIALETKLSITTVRRILRAAGMNRLKYLDPAPPARRYEHPAPGMMLHIDAKKLARIEKVGHRITGDRRHSVEGAGWEFAFVAIDDHTRIAFSALQPDERGASALAFLEQALAYYRSLGIVIQRVMTDNGACFRSRAFTSLLRCLGIKHVRTRPYTPRTNGKAERFIQTLQREWAYARTYHHSRDRAAALPSFIHNYNWHRDHGALDYRPPITRLTANRNDLLAMHT